MNKYICLPCYLQVQSQGLAESNKVIINPDKINSIIILDDDFCEIFLDNKISYIVSNNDFKKFYTIDEL